MFEPVTEMSDDAVIKVVGVGGGGGNAVDHMVRESIEGVEFITINTDAQALRKSNVSRVIQIGSEITKGLGAGANPQVGRDSALEDLEKIKEELSGADMVFVAAGMGGGTGTGAAPVIAEIAKELGVLTVAVVTKPFGFEGKKRMAFAEQGITELSKHVDSLITIPNEKLLKVYGRNVTLLEAFGYANDVLKDAVQGIAELITRPGMINVDFADVRTVMSEMGQAMMGSGQSTGEDRAEEAAEAAISHSLLEDIDLAGARGVLVNITAGLDMRLDEFEIVGNTVKAFASDNATVVIGTSLDPDMSDEFRVTVVATGIGNEKKPEITLVSGVANKPKSPVTSNQEIEPKAEPVTPKAQPVANTTEPEKTPVKQPAPQSTATQGNQNVATKTDRESGYLDIPAFLRRQAD